MPDAHALGGYAGQAIFAGVCLAAFVVGVRLLRGSRRRGPSLWLGLHLTATAALVAFAIAGEAVGLDEPIGSWSDRVYLSLLALGAGVFLLHLPFAWSYPRQRPAEHEALVAGLPWIAPVFGALYVFLAWPGPEPAEASLAPARTAEAMRQAWFNRYDVLEDGALWLVMACLVVGVLAALSSLAYRALRRSGSVAQCARRMLAQALAPVGAWLVASAVLVSLAMLAPGGPVGSAVAFGFEVLWDGGVPFALALVGPVLWGLDLLHATRSGGRVLSEPAGARAHGG